MEGREGLKRDKDGVGFIGGRNDESEGSERVSRKEERGRRGVEGLSRKTVYVLFEEECILYKG